MSTADQIKKAVDHLDEQQKQVLLLIIHSWNLGDDDSYDEEGNVIVDEFYQKMIDEIDPDDEGVPAEEVYKMLGI